MSPLREFSGNSTTRVRGFAPWRPVAKSRALLDTVKAILTEYAQYLPLTVRQIFYRLVGVHDYPKTERAYKNLAELLNRGRRAELIGFEAIRDDGVTKRVPHAWKDAGQLVETFINSVEYFRLDRQRGQTRYLIFAVEAAGMVPLVERIADSYGITVISSGGFDSTTAKYDMARTLSELAQVEVLHIGDHDPSGVHVFSSMAEDVSAFSEGLGAQEPIFTRLAVTPAQIISLSLPTAPAKETDRRSFNGETTQVEAIPPDVLSAIISEAIEQRLDQEAYDAVLAQEETVKAQLRASLLPALRRLADR
jgi:hypothetical protein